MRCVECSVDLKKYKCPNCSENCCSFECFKKHKNVNCTPTTSISASNESNDSKNIMVNQRRQILQFTTDDTVDPEKLSQLGENDDLKNLLRNKHLRDLIKAVDSSQNAWKSIRFAMLEPLFIEFANECLKVVDPETLNN